MESLTEHYTSSLPGVLEDGESHTAKETWQVFILYSPLLSAHQLALPPWEGSREDHEPEIDASTGVSLPIVPISVWILCQPAGSIRLPSAYRGYLFGILVWVVDLSSGA